MSFFRRIAVAAAAVLLSTLAMAEPATLAKRPVARPVALLAPVSAPRPPARPDGLASAARAPMPLPRDGPDCRPG